MATQGICSIKGCGKPHYSRGWCQVHYYRWYRTGDPVHRKIIHGASNAFVALAVTHSSDDCLLWPYARCAKGYAIMGKRKFGTGSASRAVCIIVHGSPLTPKHQAAHGCGNGHLGCVNPKHLRWALPIENEADKVAHGTYACGERHWKAKLTEAQVSEIKKRIARKQSYAALGREFSVTESAIRRIAYGLSWADVL